MNCVIIEDEPLALNLLESYVRQVEGLTLIRSYTNAVDAFTFLQSKTVDLLFLDIELPQISGLELLKSLKNRPPVIMTTAYRDYAVDAYDLDVVDYLLKPVTFERFLRSISKVYQGSQSTSVEAAANPLTNDFDRAYIFLREDREMVKVYLKDILYIESLRDYVRVKTHDRQIITYQKISYLEQKLPENKFIRIHRSFLVAIEKVTGFTPLTVLIGEKTLPLGRNYKYQALKAFHSDNVIF
ncbi:LytR/AlgR family response regulator transcription factor [Larkinella rosea]|uniref:DNA-binding response regulator n=1 Tax=Larkinella rosea TaxID=2025312 RepID=A0A3P1BGI2_9BACT|nr:LytTR family DNA-binding domain-containing protein [Larkinella rosea]RRB00082.1 DNA-binding response regulator [Larkinella rosea]